MKLWPESSPYFSEQALIPDDKKDDMMQIPDFPENFEEFERFESQTGKLPNRD